MNEATATPAGVTMDIDLDKPTDVSGAQGTPPPADNPGDVTTQVNNDFIAKLPKEYAEEEWAKNLAKAADPWSELIKEHKNAQGLIGKKGEGLKVPGEGATEDEWKAFHKSIGAPESIEGYTYEAPSVPDNLKGFFQQDDELINTMKAAALKAGMTPQGWKELSGAFDGYYLNKLQAASENANQTMAKLENDFKSKYGDRSNVVLEKSNEMLGLAPEWTKAIFDALPDVARTALAAYNDEVRRLYIKEDRIDTNVAPTGHAMTEAEYGDKYAELFAAQRAHKPGSPEHEKAKAEMTALRARYPKK